MSRTITLEAVSLNELMPRVSHGDQLPSPVRWLCQRGRYRSAESSVVRRVLHHPHPSSIR
jgi:hypothetical protein